MRHRGGGVVELTAKAAWLGSRFPWARRRRLGLGRLVRRWNLEFQIGFISSISFIFLFSSWLASFLRDLSFFFISVLQLFLHEALKHGLRGVAD